MKILVTFLALLLSAHLSAATFTFTAIPDQDESQLHSRFDKIARYLSTELGIDVRYIPVKSYSSAVTAFRNDQVQLAWFGGLSGVRARRLVPGSQAIAQGYEDQFFKSYFIAHHSTGLTPRDNFPTEIANLTFTFGSKGSTSGRLMPEFYIRQSLDKAPNQVFRRVGFSGDHSRTIAQVQAGAYQIGAVNYKVWEKELAAGKIDPAKVQVIWTTPSYPDYQWSIRGDVDQHFGAGITEKVTQALLQMNDKDLLDSFPRSRFVPATNADFQPVADVADSIGL